MQVKLSGLASSFIDGNYAIRGQRYIAIPLSALL